MAGLLRDRTPEYRRTLLEAARQFLVTGVDYGLGLVGLFEDSNFLIARINWLEKPIWRYQKMKKLAATSLALILLACVLPMAQAQQDSVSETPDAGPALSEDSSAKGIEKSQAEQAQSQRLEQLQKAMQALQAQLQQLEPQKQKLEQEIHELSHAERKAHHTRKPEEQTLITQAFFDCELGKDVLPALSANAGIPIIVDGTVDGLVTCKLEGKPLDTALDIVLAGTLYTYKKMPDHYLVYSPDINANFRYGSTGNIEIKKDNDGKYAAKTEMTFRAKAKSGKPFVIRNKIGKIDVSPSKNGGYYVRAIVRASGAKNAAEAREMAERVVIYGQALKDQYYVSPEKADNKKWSNLCVDFLIKVPQGAMIDVKTDLGNVVLYNLDGHIKAVTNIGAINAINTSGNLELLTNMGSIDFIAPKDLSAKISILTKMGSIKSELPLEINQSDMFRKGAQGTVGAGKGNIRMTTDMGSINLKWYSAPKDSPTN